MISRGGRVVRRYCWSHSALNWTNISLLDCIIFSPKITHGCGPYPTSTNSSVTGINISNLSCPWVKKNFHRIDAAEATSWRSTTCLDLGRAWAIGWGCRTGGDSAGNIRLTKTWHPAILRKAIDCASRPACMGWVCNIGHYSFIWSRSEIVHISIVVFIYLVPQCIKSGLHATLNCTGTESVHRIGGTW